MPRPFGFSTFLIWLSGAWIVACLVMVGLTLLKEGFRLHWTTDVYLASTLFMSAIAFGAMGLDKFKATHNVRRLPESMLHTFELLGGWPGSLLGQRAFRHKTNKTIYQIVFGGIMIFHLLLIGWLLYVWWNAPPVTSQATEKSTQSEPAAP